MLYQLYKKLISKANFLMNLSSKNEEFIAHLQSLEKETDELSNEMFPKYYQIYRKFASIRE